MSPIYITASGMVNSVGFTAASSCAAIRCALQNISETDFVDKAGERILGASVPFAEPVRGMSRLVKMVAPAIAECFQGLGKVHPSQVPLLLCVSETTRPGRIAKLDEQLLPEIQRELGVRFHPNTALIPNGRVSIALALQQARELVETEKVPFCLIGGVDSYLYAPTATAYEEKRRLLTTDNSNGFILGEAAAAVLVGAVPSTKSHIDLQCIGLGTAVEKATVDSEEPLRADGLTAAINVALGEAGCTMYDIAYRICDVNGEQYAFKEAAIGLTRTLRQKREEFDIWHPADCIGEVGAAIGPTILGVSLAAARKEYAPGPVVLAHFGSDDGARAAMIFKPSTGDAN